MLVVLVGSTTRRATGSLASIEQTVGELVRICKAYAVSLGSMVCSTTLLEITSATVAKRFDGFVSLEEVCMIGCKDGGEGVPRSQSLSNLVAKFDQK